MRSPLMRSLNRRGRSKMRKIMKFSNLNRIYRATLIAIGSLIITPIATQAALIVDLDTFAEPNPGGGAGDNQAILRGSFGSNPAGDRVYVGTFDEVNSLYRSATAGRMPISLRGGTRIEYTGGNNTTATSNLRRSIVTGNNEINNQFTLQNTTNVGADVQQLGLVFKADFEALNLTSVSFDNTSSLSIRVRGFGNTDSFSFNWVVKNGDDYYMNTAPSTGTGDRTITLNDPNSALWSIFDPTANSGDLSGVSSLTSGGSAFTFDNIEAVGWYKELSGTDSVGTANYRYGDFQVSAVPEASSILFLSSIIAVGLLRLRLQKRRARGELAS